jgi:hypothetical protein
VGVFAERIQAARAINALRLAGFTDEQIGFLTRNQANIEGERALDEHAHDGPSTTSGAVGGGVLGGVLGMLTALLLPGLGPILAAGTLAVTLGGVVLGAAAGGLAAGLMKMGIPEAEAHRYQDDLVAGRSLVTVTTSSRYADAVTLLRQNGAINADSMGDAVTPDKPETESEAEQEEHSEIPILFPSAVGDPMSGTVGTVGGPLVPASDPVVFADPQEEETLDMQEEEEEDQLDKAEATR